MVNPPVVGYRFRPTDEEIVDYLRQKNLDSDTSYVNRVFSTINISKFDPWDLPYQSIMKSGDQVWYYFGRKENKYNRGDRQIRKTKSGFWKKTGKPTEIKRKSGNREKIGEKCVLVFHMRNGSKTKWVMHEYHLFSPDQMMMTYTLCKVKFKGEESEISSMAGGGEIEHSQMNNYGELRTGFEGRSFVCPQSQELENPQQSSGFLDVLEETQLEDAMRTISNMSTDEWNNLLNDDDYEHTKIMFMQNGVFIGDNNDDDDSHSIIATTDSVQTLSICDSFCSSNHRVDQITYLQESANSTIKLSKKWSKLRVKRLRSWAKRKQEQKRWFLTFSKK